MSRSRRAVGVFVGVGAFVALGGGVAYALSRVPNGPPLPPPAPPAPPPLAPSPPPPASPSSLGEAAAAPGPLRPAQGPPAPPPAADPETSAEPDLFWTKASIVVSSWADPYGPGTTQAAIQAQQLMRNNSLLGRIVNTGQAILAGLIPGGAAILGLLNAVGDAIQRDSAGGFDELPDLAQKLAVLYQLGPFMRYQGSFYSQSWEPTAPMVRPQRFDPRTQLRNPTYNEEFPRWVRYVLVRTRKQAEWFRIVRTSDEAMLPQVVIVGLIGSNMWPPPLEPLSPNPFDPSFSAVYSLQNPIRDYPSSYAPADYYEIVQRTDSPADQQDDGRRADEVYRELHGQYDHDAASFAAAIAPIKWVNGTGAGRIDMTALAETSGCVPALGTRANPAPASSGRRGVR